MKLSILRNIFRQIERRRRVSNSKKNFRIIIRRGIEAGLGEVTRRTRQMCSSWLLVLNKKETGS